MEPERDQQNTSHCGCILSLVHSTRPPLLFLSGAIYYAKERNQRSEAWKLKIAARNACEDEWKQIKIRHDNAVLAWNTECERLKVTGT